MSFTTQSARDEIDAGARLHHVTEQARLEPAPVLVAAVALAGAVTLATVDPSHTRLAPPCPFHALTGWWCPLCGGTRAAHALVHGDISRAASFNALVTITAPLVIVAWVMWCIPSLRLSATRQSQLTAATAVVGGLSAVAFLLARNTVWPALAP